MAALLGTVLSHGAKADPAMEDLNGVPQLAIPLVDELGLGDYVPTTGTVSLLSGSGNGSGSGGGGDGSGGASGGTGMPAGDTAALNMMNSMS